MSQVIQGCLSLAQTTLARLYSSVFVAKSKKSFVGFINRLNCAPGFHRFFSQRDRNARAQGRFQRTREFLLASELRLRIACWRIAMLIVVTFGLAFASLVGGVIASETQANERGVGYRLAKIPLNRVQRARTLSETRGFMKALIDADSDPILGFSVFGVEAGEIMASVQVAMIAGLPYTALRGAIFIHPTMLEGLIALFDNVPPASVPIFEEQLLHA